MRWLGLVVGIWIAAAAGEAWAQTAAKPTSPHHPEIDLGAAWIGGGALGSADANLTTPSGGSQPLFSVSHHLGIETALEAHLAFRLVSRLRAEVTGTWGQAELRARVTGDLEGAAPVTVTNRLRVVTVQGAGIWYFKRRGKWEPFLRGGAGWMRQLTADYAVAGDGTIANAGIGVKYWWFERNRGLLERVGLRSDARVVGRFGGLEVGTTTRLITPAVSVAAIIGF